MRKLTAIMPPNLDCFIPTTAGKIIPIRAEIHTPHIRGMAWQGLSMRELTASVLPGPYRCITTAAGETISVRIETHTPDTV